MATRRRALALAGAVPFALARAVAADSGPALRVAVIGAGILGASIAYHLACAGARVTVLEKARPGAGATQGAFAMLISTHDEGPPELNTLYGRALLDWRRLERELGVAIAVQWGGQITWAPPGAAAEKIKAAALRLEGWGSAVRLIDEAEMGRLAPGVAPGPVGAASFTADTGAVDPIDALAALVGAARRRGAEFRYPCEVRQLVSDGRRITRLETSAGPLASDVVVLAAGRDAPALAAGVAVRTPIHGPAGWAGLQPPRSSTASRLRRSPPTRPARFS